MSTARGTWKAGERRVAAFFGTLRTSLSGGNSKITRSDTMHKRLFIETKMRKAFSILTLWRETAELAKKEGKTPAVCIQEKGKRGFWILVHSDHLEEVALYAGWPEPGYICDNCAKIRGAVWPPEHLATAHIGRCPECKKKVGLVSVDDWGWPEGSKRPAIGAGRD